MGTRYLKVHYNREWQVITDVEVWGYRYANLMKDIRRKFMPNVATIPKLKVECEVKGQYVSICDDDGLVRCLLFGEDEIDIYVEVMKDSEEVGSGVQESGSGKSSGGGRGEYNSQLGYFVEEVEDEATVVILDSDTDEVGEEEDNVVIEEEGAYNMEEENCGGAEAVGEDNINGEENIGNELEGEYTIDERCNIGAELGGEYNGEAYGSVDVSDENDSDQEDGGEHDDDNGDGNDEDDVYEDDQDSEYEHDEDDGVEDDQDDGVEGSVCWG